MGIPHLLRHLAPYAETIVLGCKAKSCEEHPTAEKIVIDGPSLAYYIYYRILAHRPADLCPVDAIPSYDELGKAVLTFLEELQCCGAIIKHIYFDGCLPVGKVEVRKARLEACLKELVYFHAAFSSGFKVSNNATSFSIVTGPQVLNSARSVRSALKLHPSPAFLVPVVLDALCASNFASVTSVVPGEADAFCAHAVSKGRATILTSDSDLLVYDLGVDSSVAFFNQIELQKERGSSSQCEVLRASVSRPAVISTRLGLRNLKRLGFEIKEDSWVSLLKAMSRAKEPMDKSTGSQTSDRVRRFIEFEMDYSIEHLHLRSILNSQITFGANLSTRQFLDPRISEFLSQSPTPSFIFLPFLTDDPSRSSAWIISRKLRSFAYSFLFQNLEMSLPKVSEYARKGFRMIQEDMEILTHVDTTDFTISLIEKIEKVRSRFPDLSIPFRWRIFALNEMLCWYRENGKTPPLRKTMIMGLLGSGGEKLGWSDVHFSAEMDAILYAVRMLKQILNHHIADVEEMTKTATHQKPSVTALPPGLLALQKTLHALPPLKDLLPPRRDLVSLPPIPPSGVAHIFDFLDSSLLENRKGDALGPGNTKKQPFQPPMELTSKSQKKNQKRRAKTLERKTGPRPDNLSAENRNRFQLLLSE